jgi:4-amino-4-deoxy-L-arabinose transferase-like glycosyltransferase
VGKLKPHLNKLLLSSIFLVLASSTVLWTLEDRTPPSWDPSHHMVSAYDYYRPLAHFDLRGFARDFFGNKQYYAPLIHLITAGAFLIFGASRLSGIAVNFISLAVLLGSVSYIGRAVYCRDDKDEAQEIEHASATQFETDSTALTLGAVAALVSTSYHFNAWLMHDAFLDYPLIALVALSFALLIRAGDFSKRSDAMKFAVAAGLGLLAKQTFAFFFVLPAIYVTIRILAKRDRKAIINLALAASVIAAMAAIWYVPHMRDVIEIYRINKQGAIDENEPALLSRDSLIFYFHSLISMQMQMPFALLFGIGLIYSLIRSRKQSVMLYLWLLSGIGAFTFIANKDVRYTVPVLPAAALLSVCWLREFWLRSRARDRRAIGQAARPPSEERLRMSRGARGLKLALVAPIVAWAFVSFFNAQWPAPGQGVFIDTPYFRWMVFARNYFVYDHRPLPDDWSVPEIARTAAEFPYDENSPSARALRESRPLRQKFPSLDPHEIEKSHFTPYGDEDVFVWPTLGVVVNRPFLNSSAIALYARFLAPERGGMPLITVESISNESEIERIDVCDYLLVRTGLDHAERVEAVEREVEKMIRANPDRFTQVASFPTPLEGIEAVIYKCWR